MYGLDRAKESPVAGAGGSTCDCFDLADWQSARGRNSDTRDYSEFLSLAQTVEGEVLPRLLLTERVDRRLVSNGFLRQDQKVEEFTRIVLEKDVTAANDYLWKMRDSGISDETIMTEFLGPAARRLGEYWLQDRCSFFDVTMGLCRLLEILKDFSRGLDDDTTVEWGFGRRVLLSPAPGEQHTFGLMVVEEYIRRARWDPLLVEDGDPGHVVRAVAADHFSVACFSMSCDHFQMPLAQLIADVRAASANPHVLVMVGGQWFNEDPRRVGAVGADACAVDGRQAIVQIRGMLSLTDAQDRPLR